MNTDEQRVGLLLAELADTVEADARLAEIITAGARARDRATRRRWAGAVALVAASVLAALVLTAGGPVHQASPQPAAPTGPTPSSTPSDDPSTPGTTVSVYYIGDTPEGPRLFRELRRTEGDLLTAAASGAVGRDVQGRKQYPVDKDYRTVWPPLTSASARLSEGGDMVDVSLGGDPERDLRDRGTLPPAEARLAVEALVRTVQDAAGQDLPVRLLLFGEPTDRVLGVPASEPLDASPDPDVLAWVSVTEPAENLLVDNDDPFVVRGLARTAPGGVLVSVVPVSGDPAEVEVVAPTTGGRDDDVSPFEVVVDLHGVAPGDYEVIARSEDSSDAERYQVDNRTITVVE